MISYHYRVAGLTFRLNVPEDGPDPARVMPSFAPFACEASAGEPLLFDFTVVRSLPDAPVGSRVIDRSDSDMGRVVLMTGDGGYRVEIRPAAGCRVCPMRADNRFATVEGCVHGVGQRAGQVLSSMLRIVFSQAILGHDGLLLHASVVVRAGLAYLFMGRSGTGKSTHSALWLANLPGTSLLNDDNPAVRIVDGHAVACGTPWSGKTPCYRNLCVPVAGMARLSQGPANRFERCDAVGAFVAMLPGCSAIIGNETLRNALYDTLTWLGERVPVARLECRPDAEAARLCCSSFDEILNSGKTKQ